MTTYNIPHTFIPGTKAKANEVNENFAAVLDYIATTKQSSADVNLSNLTTEGKDVIYANSVPTHLIGEIITAAMPLTDAGLHLLNGELISGDGVYSEFVSHMQTVSENYPTLFCTEEEWQSTVANKGVCGKFVYDSAHNILRLPKMSELPEITEEAGELNSIDVLYYIVTANGIKKEADITIDNIATDLNNKASTDLANCTKPYVIETYKSGTSWYRLWSDGWCEQGNWQPTGNINVTFLKPYKDTSYTLASVGFAFAGIAEQIVSKRNDGFSTSSVANTAYSYSWVAMGYIS